MSSTQTGLVAGGNFFDNCSSFGITLAPIAHQRNFRIDANRQRLLHFAVGIHLAKPDRRCGAPGLGFAAVIGHKIRRNGAQCRTVNGHGEMIVKTPLLAAALLMTASLAMAQAPAPEAAPAAPAAPAARPVRKPVVHAAAPAAAPAKQLDVMEVSQIVAIRQVDPSTYEIDAKLQNGVPINLRMNAFVMQDLGRQLGTYGK